MELYATGTVFQPPELKTRNLGDAIFLAAIDDYRSMDEDMHKDAEQFLYPRTPAWQDQYDWAVALSDGLNPAWLRDTLDRCKGKWDGQRFARKTSARPRKENCKPRRRGAADEARKCS
jgi:hypothetical protein